MESKKFAIIVAGGSGSRMNSDTPKQFLTVGKHSIIAYTISKFLQSDEQLQVIVVIPKAHELLWLQLPNEIVEHSRGHQNLRWGDPLSISDYWSVMY